jgi:hypothetical protein
MSQNEWSNGLQNVRNLGQIADGASDCKAQCEAPTLRIALPAGCADMLRQLFFDGPTWDGNVVSKQSRDELVRMGLAASGHGWQWLTKAGIDACFDNGIQHAKESRDRRVMTRRNTIHALAEAVLGGP